MCFVNKTLHRYCITIIHNYYVLNTSKAGIIVTYIIMLLFQGVCVPFMVLNILI